MTKTHRIISANLNGIRAAQRKGFFTWAAKQEADIICVQELKAQEADLSEEMFTIASGQRLMQGYFYAAQKKGYSGVGLYCHEKPLAVRRGFGVAEFDDEGRYLEVELEHLVVVALYVPSGSANEARLASKFRFMEIFTPHMRALLERCKQAGKELVVCADWNVAHKEIDLKNWKANLKNPGFSPQERAWVSDLTGPSGFVDAYRVLEPETVQYTWWSARGAAWDNNVGWRLDYMLTSPGLAAKAKRAVVYMEERFSDHAPLIMDFA
jgi:exodeoxyribonuclease III